MSNSRKRIEPLYRQASLQLSKHYLLAPVVERIRFIPDNMRSGIYIWIKGTDIFFNVDAELTLNQWLGYFSLGTLIIALGAARHLPHPSLITDLTGQLAALH